MNINWLGTFAVLTMSYAALAQTPTWTHNPADTNGALNWGAVTASYGTCGTRSGTTRTEVGMKQTPINIEAAKAIKAVLPELRFQYKPNELVVENTGHVIEVPVAAGSSLRVGRNLVDDYRLVQFHFHVPSEHTVDGKSFPAEMHLVHSNALGELAVVGVLLAESEKAHAGLFEDIISHAPATVGEQDLHSEFNPRELLPEDRNYFTYTGSLTTPPCTEGVHWYVMTTPVEVTTFVATQLRNLVGQFPNYNGYQSNNRPVTPTNGRAVLASH